MFTLEIPVNSKSLEIIKASLLMSLPEVKSSHRCEAAARSFGFGSHAALLAAVKNQQTINVSVNGFAFRDYLRSRNFDKAPASAIYIAGAEVAIETAKAREPSLTWLGIGVGDVLNENGKMLTMESRRNRLEIERRKFCGSHFAEEMLRGLALLSRIKRIKSLSRYDVSYSLKHMAEDAVSNYPTGEKLGPDYVSNGALIAAAITAGFDWKATGLNVRLNISTSSYRSLTNKIEAERSRRQKLRLERSH